MGALSNHVLRDHVLVGGVAALCLRPYWGWDASLAFWISTVLVDIDHYLDYLACSRFKKPGIRSMFRFHEELFKKRDRKEFLALEIFHTAEFMALLGLLAFWRGGILLAIFWAVALHMLTDVVHLGRYHILSKRCNSIFEYLWRRRRLVAQGKDPAAVVTEALKAAGCVPEGSNPQHFGGS